MFNELRNTAKLAKGKLTFINKNTAYLEHSHWGDIVDNMYDMMFNKAKQIMRKTDEADRGNIVKPKENKRIMTLNEYQKKHWKLRYIRRKIELFIQHLGLQVRQEKLRIR